MPDILPLVLELSIIACALVAGVFLTFSDFVMKSLGAAKPAAGIEVMQMINRKVWATVFMVLLVGWCAFSPLMAGFAYFNIEGPAGLWIMAGGLAYTGGVFAVSFIYNIPMNKRLDVMDCNSAKAADYWQTVYLPRWTFWNWVRAITSAVSAVCYLVALLLI